MVHLLIEITEEPLIQLSLKNTVVTAIFNYMLLAPVLESLTCVGTDKSSSGSIVTAYRTQKNK